MKLDNKSTMYYVDISLNKIIKDNNFNLMT